MVTKTLDIQTLISPDGVAEAIGLQWHEWNSLRSGFINESREIRNYVFATDTSTTSNGKLPWANSTTTPKLTQIYDNLKANYSAALFPNADWLRWEGDDRDDNSRAKKEVIQAYMSTKLRQSSFEKTMDRLIDDYVLYGNCFATVEYVEDIVNLPTGETIEKYIGPRVVRISPYDIVFNPTAADFENTPKIIRSLLTIGEVAKLAESDPNYKVVYDKMMVNRKAALSSTLPLEKSDAFVADGFSNINHYYGSNYVEVLTFYGDLFDITTETYLTNHKITVVDRAYVVKQEPIASWLGSTPVYHSGWRSRPDNLYSMSPLANLVGMQYRIDHLENLKADVFDQIALPMLKIKGDVEEFTHQPGERIYIGDEGDVGYLHPDTTALNADFQIQALENKMEEMAGAPRQAMGVRTPGEKTAFEVQSLDNAAGRIFQHKAKKLEVEMVQQVLNGMLEAGRRNLDVTDVVRVVDSDLGLESFVQITRDDLKASGKLYPVGASHFAERAQRVQNLQQLAQFKSDPTIAPHLSGKAIARLLSEELGEKELYGENISVQEQLETQRQVQDAEAQNINELEEKAELGM